MSLKSSMPAWPEQTLPWRPMQPMLTGSLPGVTWVVSHSASGSSVSDETNRCHTALAGAPSGPLSVSRGPTNDVATPCVPAMMYGKVVLWIPASIVQCFQVAPPSAERATWWRQSSPVHAYQMTPLGATETVGLFAPLAIGRVCAAGPST